MEQVGRGLAYVRGGIWGEIKVYDSNKLYIYIYV